MLKRSRKKYRKTHPEYARKYLNRYLENNRDKVRETKRLSANRHPETRAENASIRRARKSGVLIERVYRSVIFKRDGGICGECQDLVDPKNWHLDHVIPLSKGGPHSYANTRVTHPKCNLQKGPR